MSSNDQNKPQKDQQIKSKQRVADHGEVFTAERKVNAMLDPVKQETERIDSTFLEIKTPFLIQIATPQTKGVQGWLNCA